MAASSIEKNNMVFPFKARVENVKINSCGAAWPAWYIIMLPMTYKRFGKYVFRIKKMPASP